MAFSVAETFANYRQILNKPFLRNEPGIAWQRTLGAGQDESFNRFVQSKLQRMPTECATDGLQYLASERELERGIGETETSYREVLRTAWTVWTLGGTTTGETNALARMGCGSVTVKRRKDFANPAADSVPYITAFARDVWAQFDVILQKPMPWNLRTWGTPPPWGTGVWGTTATAAQISQLRRLLRTFRAGHDTPTYVWMHFGSGSLWGLGAWGPPRTWGGTGPVMRLVVGEIHWATRFLVPPGIVGYTP